MKFNNPLLPLTLIGCVCIALATTTTSLVGARKTFIDKTNSTKSAGNSTQSTGNTTQQVAHCGKLPEDNHEPAAPEGWQFFGTVVGEKETRYCGATVIDAKHVITTRTCGYTISTENGGRSLRVVLSDPRRHSDSFVGQVLWAKNDCSSANYSIRPSINGMHLSMNDFLVIPLEEQLTFNNHTQPICLPSPAKPIQANETSELRCLQVGHKHQEQLELESFEVEYTKCWLEDDSQFCFLRKDQHRYSTCGNDSGSPIICHKDNKWHMIGMVSTVYRTCDEGHDHRYNVATKLSYIQRLESFKKCMAMK